MSSPTDQSNNSSCAVAAVSAAAALEELCSVVASIVKDLRFSFSDDSLNIRQLDEEHVCYAEARFPLEIHNFKIGHNFTVAAKQMLVVLRDIHLDDVVHIVQEYGSEFIQIVAISARRNQKWSIPIIRQRTDEPLIENFSLSFGIGIKVSCLKTFLAVARKLDPAADISIAVLGTAAKGDETYFAMSTIGTDEGGFGRTIYRTTTGGNVTETDIVPESKLIDIPDVEMYSAVFPKMYLRRLTKNMKKDNFITLCMSPGRPLHISYSVGSCHARFMLASTCLG